MTARRTAQSLVESCSPKKHAHQVRLEDSRNEGRAIAGASWAAQKYPRDNVGIDRAVASDAQAWSDKQKAVDKTPTGTMRRVVRIEVKGRRLLRG